MTHFNCNGGVPSVSEPGTLKIGEYHPCADIAMQYLRDKNLFIHLESLSSCAIEGNRTAEICLGTLNRLLNKEPVSDRYLMGLALFLLDYEFKDNL
jgi:hypothetical protein